MGHDERGHGRWLPLTRATVTCTGPFGPVEPLSGAIPFEDFRDQGATASGDPHGVEKAIEEPTAAVGEIAQRR